MSVKDVAHGLVDRCRSGDFFGAIDTYYSDDIVSIEAAGNEQMPAEMRGLDKVRGKNELWVQNNDVHNVDVEGPFIGDDSFAVRYTFDVTNKATGQRGTMTEMALYTVEDDKITREQFYYNAP